jgi:tetratricopeptide (TPR) repeat protein
MSDPNEPKRPAPGFAGRASSIGKELGNDLDFEPDALLDSLLFDEAPVAAAPTPRKIKLHEPVKREFSEDEVTVVGRAEDLFARVKADDGTSGLEDLANSDIDQLLSSTPASAPVELPLIPPMPAPPSVVIAPELPAVPRVTSAVPRPGLRVTSSVPRPGSDTTAKAPAVNPAGPPPRQPFPPAVSPQAPRVAPRPVETANKAMPPRPGPSLENQAATERPPSAQPTVSRADAQEEEEERTRIYTLPTSPSAASDAAQPKASAGLVQPDPFADPEPISVDPRSSMPTLHQMDAPSHLPTLAPPAQSGRGSLPSILDPVSSPSAAVRDSELELLPFSEAPDPFTAEEADELTARAEVSIPAEARFSSIPAEARFSSIPAEARFSSIPADALGVSSIPPRTSIPPAIWPDERPASDHLGATREAWVERAEWLESEAQGATDPQAKARALIVASELWALVGELTRAREVATEAAALPRAQPMAARQLRALAAADRDYKAVAPALELEIRGAATADARVHAAYLSAEVHRLALDDDATAKKKLDIAVRALQDDPRAHVAKLVDLLGKSNAPARVRFPESPALAELVKASDELLRLRGAPPAAGSTPAQGPRVAFEEARRALSAGDREKAVEALDKLAGVEGLATACAWLSAALLGADPKTRGRAITGLSELAARGGSRLARRALATRALEQGDAEAVRSAVSGAQGQETFSATDRVALAALTGIPAHSMESTVWELAGVADLRPLAAAWVAATRAGALDVRSGSDASRAELRLGQSIAASPTAEPGLGYLRPDAETFERTHPDHPLARLLALEFARASGAKAPIARALGEWPQAERSPQAEHDQKLAAGLVYELAGDQTAAANEYRRALELDPTSEASLRALASGAPGETANLLLTLADRLEASPRAALALIEAALRKGSEDTSAFEALLERAKVADPSLPLSYRLAEITARQHGDRDALLSALRARRETSDDPIERSLDLVREALLVAESDLGLAEALLEEALGARPTDLALRELEERMVPTDDHGRAAWREQLAEVSQGPLRARMFAEAALERGRGGDREAAARDAYRAADAGSGPLALLAAERYAALGPAAARISESLLERARATEVPSEQRDLYERLSYIDRARGDTSSALLWQTAILEQSPEHLPALRRLEHAYISGDRLDELEPIAVSLARVLDSGEANAHARLAARLRLKRGAWSESREMAEISLQRAESPLWALRSLSAHARAAEDNELGLRVDERLFELAYRPLDKATLALRAAEAAARLDRNADTKRLLSAAIEQVPDHLVALTTLAEVLEAGEEYADAARALETAAQASSVAAHQVSAWHQAAVLWLDKANDPERGKRALEHAVALDVSHEDAVVRLQSLYVTAGDRQKLAELLQRRLEHTTDPEERVAIEVTRGRALAEVGEKDAAKAALAAALDANPDHAEALEAFAELCLEEGDWSAGEQALIRLARHMIEPQRQAQIYRRLGELYDTALPNPERAELAYKEVLKRDPDDAATVARLVLVYGRMGDKATAHALQSDLLGRAKTPEEKRDRTLALAVVEEQIAGDRRRAEGTFEKARKEWPQDSAVLRALAEFQQRGGETRAVQVLLDRAATDARRALGTGRFEPAFFDILATVAELKHVGDTALVARSTLAALHGEDLAVPAAGPVAGDPRLDDLLAPELVSPALRALLRKSGDLLDAAYPVDLRALRAAPLPVSSAAFTSYVQQVAAAFGIRGLEVFSSPALGQVCMPVSAAPPQIVFGQALLDSSDDAARYFLLIRSLKILQANAAALSRTAPIELWPVLAAYLLLFASNWQPQGVDAKKLSDAQKRLQGVTQRRLDDDVPVLALEVIGAIGNRASLVGTALHQWGNRTALLSAGSLVASLRGVALAGGHTAGPPADGAERVKWIVRNPEARDLATFSVSEQYAEVRTRIGLGH